jgi:hypothetical protein
MLSLIQDAHKLWDYFARTYIELQMCNDIKISVKYNTMNYVMNVLNLPKVISHVMTKWLTFQKNVVGVCLICYK